MLVDMIPMVIHSSQKVTKITRFPILHASKTYYEHNATTGKMDVVTSVDASKSQNGSYFFKVSGTDTYDGTTADTWTDVENFKGTILPSTGGVGTTLFYLIGAILVIGAGVVLVTRRRVGTEE